MNVLWVSGNKSQTLQATGCWNIEGVLKISHSRVRCFVSGVMGMLTLQCVCVCVLSEEQLLPALLNFLFFSFCQSRSFLCHRHIKTFTHHSALILSVSLSDHRERQISLSPHPCLTLRGSPPLSFFTAHQTQSLWWLPVLLKNYRVVGL